jgi:hypothetical protein
MTGLKGSEILDAAVALGGAQRPPAKPIRHNDERQQSGLQDGEPSSTAINPSSRLARRRNWMKMAAATR